MTLLEDRAELERLAAGVLMIGFAGHTVPADTRALLASGVRNVILFARNLGDAEQIKALTTEVRAVAGPDALIAVDHEGGRVNRLEAVSTAWPSPMAWAAAGDSDLTRRASATAAGELAALGINLNFAPVADLLGDYRNPVLGTRCFSDDPETASTHVGAFVRGHRSAGVGATAKHFPGHGGTSVDSHLALPRIDHSRDELWRNDLAPFVAAVSAGVDCLMISHVWYSELDDVVTPASLSARVVDLARKELKFDGVIVTDCLEMGAIQEHVSTPEAAVHAIQAGADLAIVSHDIELQRGALDRLTAAAREGTLPRRRLEEANRRIDALRSRVGLLKAGRPENGDDLARELARRSVTVVRDHHGWLPVRLDAGAALGVVTFTPALASRAENARAEVAGLAGAARGFHACVIEAQVTGEDDVDRVLAQLADAAVVVVGTAFATGHPIQGPVVDALVRAGRRVIVVALRDPFDLLAFPEAPCYLATYGDERFQVEAALAVIFGRATPAGQLPVELPGLYRRAHQLAETQ